jgi:PAS domain S-box-containing protein
VSVTEDMGRDDVSPDEIRQWAEILEAADLGMAVLDGDGTVTHWNGPMQDIFGHAASDIVGKSAIELGSRVGAVSEAGQDLAVLRTRGDWDGELNAQRPDGSVVSFSCVARPLRDSSVAKACTVVLATPTRPGSPELSELSEEIARLRAAIERRPCPLPDVPGLAALTRREREITERLRDGLRVATVAERLGLSQSTVRNHLSAAFAKLGVRSQAELLELLS